MKPTTKKQRHDALNALRYLCGMTAEQFCRLTGIGYAQLVAVEQGRRELSEVDALLISAATGVDPSFNRDKTNRALKTLGGVKYHSGSLALWREQDVPGLREGLAMMRAKGGKDAMESAVADNAAELIAAARARGQELAVFHYLMQALAETCNRFGLTDALVGWNEVIFDFKEPRALKGGNVKQSVRITRRRRTMPGIGRAEGNRRGQ